MITSTSRKVAFLALLGQYWTQPAFGAGTPRLSTNPENSRLPDGWPIRTGYVAFGDSWAAGTGAGTTENDECHVGSNNFAYMIRRLTGHEDVVDFQPRFCDQHGLDDLEEQIRIWKSPADADVATLSVGYFDVAFEELYRLCVYAESTDASPDERKLCVETRKAAQEALDDSSADSLRQRLVAAYRKILEKSTRSDFHLYVSGYPAFFNPKTPSCELTSPTKDARWDADRPAFTISKSLRAELNDLVAGLNNVIKQAVDDVNANRLAKQTHFVEVDGLFEGRRLCEDVSDPVALLSVAEELDQTRANTELSWSPQSQVPLVYPRIEAMEMYRDAIIDMITQVQVDGGKHCGLVSCRENNDL